jgi:gliding motility-associated-like protein
LTFADVTTNGLCSGSYSTTRTWTATDDCGNTSTASQTITVQDVTAPVISALPALSTINCPDVPVFEAATADDECGSTFTLTFADVTTNGPCTGSYSTTRTWTATDDCGNTSTASQTITVQDVTAPVIAALPAPSTLNCLEVPVFEVATAIDACGSAFTLTFADVTTNGLCAGSYSVTRTWTATDACNNTSTASQTITVQDVTAPVIAALPAPSTINCPDVPVFEVATAMDACGSAFTLTFADVITNGPCAGSYSTTRTWTATDACNNTSTATQTITVQDVTAPVIAALPAPSTINCPDVPVFEVATAMDACGSAFTLTFADATTSGTCAGSYSITRTWTATDACNNTSTASQTITVQDITAPVIAALPAPTTINCPATPNFAVATATDACGSAFTLTFADATTYGLCAGAYSTTRTWTATDACGNTSTASQTINVQDLTAPVIAALPAPSTINCPDVPVFEVATAMDACGSAFTLTFTDATTTGTCAGSYSTTRTWTATDACGNTSTASQTINVQDVTAPVLTCPSNISVGNDVGTCTANVIVPIPSVIENCSSYILTNSFNQTANASGLYPSGTTNIIWTATDECGNISTCSMIVTVNDNEPPSITCPVGFTICSGEQVILGTATATDNCDGNPVISNNAPSFFVPGITNIIWTATDIHGNTSTCLQTIEIITAAIVSAGADDSICKGQPYHVIDAFAKHYTTLFWTTNGKGTIENPNSIEPIYTSSPLDTATVQLFLMVSGIEPCGTAYDTLQLNLIPPLIVNAGNDITSCLLSTIKLTDVQVTNSTSIIWTTSGTGNFDNVSILNPVYTPSQTDFDNGFVYLVLNAYGSYLCGNSEDTVKVQFVKPPLANAGLDDAICSISPYTFQTSTATNFSNIIWTHNGYGHLSDSTLLNPTYIPGVGETGEIIFKLTAYGISSCGNMAFSDIVVLTINREMTAEAGNDEAIAAGTSTTLFGSATGGSGVFAYNWSPENLLKDNTVLNPFTVPLNTETEFTLTVLDLVSGCSKTDSVIIKMGGVQRPIALDDSANTIKNIPITVNILGNDSDPIGLGLDVTLIEFPRYGNVDITVDDSIYYTPNANFIGRDTLVYVICDRGTPSKCDTATVYINVFDERPELEFFNLISPDGDGANDYWHINNIEEYPDNNVIIFNRWGDRIIEINNYNNSDIDHRWNGTNDKNKLVPDGVYYYLIKIKDYKTIPPGWVYCRTKGE